MSRGKQNTPASNILYGNMPPRNNAKQDGQKYTTDPVDCENCEALLEDRLWELGQQIMRRENLSEDHHGGLIHNKACDLLEKEGFPRCAEHKRRCPDDGTCHHNCKNNECFRVATCLPLSSYGDDWSKEDLEEYQ